MKNKRSVYIVLASSALFGLALSAPASAAEVDKLVEACSACHGKEGANSEVDVPILGGTSAEYLNISLTEYKNKERPCVETKIRDGAKKGGKTDMCQVAGELSEGDIKQLASYYAAQKFVRSAQKFDPALATKGKSLHEKGCEKCHSEGGSLASDDAAILAGQKMAYLDAALKDFVEGKRPIHKKMKPKIEELDKEDLEALVHFYGSAH
ncbi:c-type cytochrome [Methylococcus sp. EFPC2]|uniref:c-type cytochrome n=1 Tax=Methylococcus sp. EFPC2 TaxID=2812648 RepID=UPI00196841E0|nr:c-type cytochrome [Methylococcus sp. EFPC2]QSA97434.1 c-type cytochrome [Methylococcus sp. EFPC2]